VAALGLWLAHLFRRDQEAFLRWNAALQRAWTHALLRGATRLFDLRLEVEGQELASSTPYLLLVRHASVVDTLLPASLIANANRIVLRYVLKEELRWDPCLDVVGGRMHNVFVSRGRGIAAAGDRLEALSATLGSEEGVLIYPEGTRFSPAKSEKARQRASRIDDPRIRELATGLRHVLPPRVGGTQALLKGNPALDVIILAHKGLESASSLADLWKGQLIGVTLRVRLQRFPHADIPGESEEQSLWLHERWREVDEWVGEKGPTGQKPLRRPA
jgi:1-acyl-sn-glycerol-3-phosphate acyltransferase